MMMKYRRTFISRHAIKKVSKLSQQVSSTISCHNINIIVAAWRNILLAA